MFVERGKDDDCLVKLRVCVDIRKLKIDAATRQTIMKVCGIFREGIDLVPNEEDWELLQYTVRSPLTQFAIYDENLNHLTLDEAPPDIASAISLLCDIIEQQIQGFVSIYKATEGKVIKLPD